MSQMVNTRKLVLALVGLPSFVGLMTYAAVPLYTWAYNVAGPDRTAASAAARVLDKTITMRFDTSLARGMEWEFKPMQREIDIRIGETALAYFEAYNPTDRVIAGTASYAVSPNIASFFFNKVECFCFQELVLQPGERVQLPVSYYVDPDIDTNESTQFVRTVTLSYTFYEIELPQVEVSLVQQPKNPLN